MMVTFILGVSVLLQFIAVFLALRLIWITGRRRAWVLIASAIFLMAIRRLIPFFRLISGNLSHPADLTTELVGLVISALTVAGIAWIAPLFYSVKRQEEALWKSELKIRPIIENMKDTIFVYDMNRQLQYVNPAFEALTGYTTKELYKKNFINYIHPDDETKMIKLWEELFQGNAFAGKEFRIITKDGQIKWCLSSWSPLFDEKGKQIGVQGTETDITERKQAEEEYRTVVRTAMDGFWIVDMEGRFGDVNDAYCRLIGYSRDELLTMKISDIEAVERTEETARRIQKIMEVGGDRFETRHKCKDGRIIDIEVSVNYMETDGGRMFVFLRDVTERKRTEEALQESEEFTRNLLASMQDGLSVLDSHGVHIDVNSAFCQMTGFSRDDLIGVGPSQPYWPPEGYEEIEKAFQKTLRGKFSNLELTFMRKNGERFPVVVSPSWIKDKQGNVISYFATVKDITERKRSEEALQESEEAAKRLAQENAIMAEIGRIISSTLNIEEVYEHFAEEVHKLISFDGIAINIINQKEGTVTIPYVSGIAVPGRQPGATFPVEGSVVEEVVRTHSGLIVQMEDKNELQARFPTLLPVFEKGFRSVIAVPLISKDQVIGTIHFRSAEPKAYSDRDLRLAENIASQIAGAVANAQLFAERKQAEEALKKSEERTKQLAKENAIMAEIGRIISSTLNIEEVYERFGEEVRKLLPFDRIAVSILNHNENTLNFAYVSGIEIPDRRKGGSLPLKNLQLNEQVIHSRSGVLVQINDEKELMERFPSVLPTFKAGLRSMISVPLISKDEVIGVLHLRSTKPNNYSETDVRLAERVGNQIAGAIANAQLYAERKRAEKALRQNEGRFRQLYDEAPVGYQEVDAEGRITRVNRTELKMLGYTEEEMLGQFLWKFNLEEEMSHQSIMAKMAGTIPPGQAFERIYRKKDGTTIPVLIDNGLIKDEKGRIIGMRSTIQDITELKRAEEALSKSEARFKRLFDEAPVGYVELNAEGRITLVNRTELNMLGYTAEEMIGQPIWKFNMEEERACQTVTAKLSGSMQTGKPFERAYKRKDGTPLPILIDDSVIRDAEGRVTGIHAIIQDITERKRAEEEMAQLQEQLRQSQKMEAVGRLAGGIAHDFNNLLTVIQGYSQLSLLDLKEGDPIKGNIEEVQKASQRAVDLTRHLLAFSRRQILDSKVLNLNIILQDLDKMLHRILGEDIELIYALDEDLGRVKTDPGQIEQVIMNLAVNARDAMPSGGKLIIETANMELDETYGRTHIGATLGPYAMVSVSDTGYGMSPQVKEHIFEPFFTTKEKGRGTGLGLSTVYGIVKQSGGYIWVDSKPGCGTTFKIYLPRVEEEVSVSRHGEDTAHLLYGNETILLVEDEPSVRGLAVRVLREQGYTLLEASNGEEALGIIQEQTGKKIHLLLTDVVMPQMSGKELADQLKILQPDIKVLYISGYTDDAIVHHGVLKPGTNFLQKPFSPPTLTHKVRGVLDG